MLHGHMYECMSTCTWAHGRTHCCGNRRRIALHLRGGRPTGACTVRVGRACMWAPPTSPACSAPAWRCCSHSPKPANSSAVTSCIDTPSPCVPACSAKPRRRWSSWSVWTRSRRRLRLLMSGRCLSPSPREWPRWHTGCSGGLRGRSRDQSRRRSPRTIYWRSVGPWGSHLLGGPASQAWDQATDGLNNHCILHHATSSATPGHCPEAQAPTSLQSTQQPWPTAGIPPHSMVTHAVQPAPVSPSTPPLLRSCAARPPARSLRHQALAAAHQAAVGTDGHQQLKGGIWRDLAASAGSEHPLLVSGVSIASCCRMYVKFLVCRPEDAAVQGMLLDWDAARKLWTWRQGGRDQVTRCQTPNIPRNP